MGHEEARWKVHVHPVGGSICVEIIKGLAGLMSGGSYVCSPNWVERVVLRRTWDGKVDRAIAHWQRVADRWNHGNAVAHEQAQALMKQRQVRG